MIAQSYSRISTFENCPRQYQLKFILKSYPDDSDNPYFKRGNEIHEQLDKYTKFKKGVLIEPLLNEAALNAKPIIDKIIDQFETVYSERRLAIDKNFQPVDWFDKSTYYRVIYDLTALRNVECLSIDWKTGKVRPYDEKGGQLHQSAAVLFGIYPEIEKITCAYNYVDHKQSAKIKFTRNDADELKESLMEKHARVNAEKDFEPKKNPNCRFCLASKKQCPLSPN